MARRMRYDNRRRPRRHYNRRSHYVRGHYSHNRRRPRHRARLNRRTHYVRGHYSRNDPARRRRHNRRRVRHYAHNRRVRRYHYNRRDAGGMRLMAPMTWLPQVTTAAAGYTLSTVVPKIGFVSNILTPLGTWGPYVANVAVAAGGAMVLPMMGFRRLAPWFFAGALMPIFVGLINQYVLPSLGLGAYLYHPSLGAYLYHPGLSGAQPPVTMTPVAARPALPAAAPVSPIRSRAIPMAPWRSVGA